MAPRGVLPGPETMLEMVEMSGRRVTAAPDDP
jgi:hypothetical protein